MACEGYLRTDLVESQVGSLLSLFTIPPAEREALIEGWAARQKQSIDHAVERTRLNARLERARSLFIEGDIEEQEYRGIRVETEAALAQLPLGDSVTPKRVAKRLAAMLADMASAWEVATPEERNAIARELFFDVVIEDRAVAAVKPKPEMLPYMQAIVGGFGDSSDEITQGRKRRDSNPRSQP